MAAYGTAPPGALHRRVAAGGDRRAGPAAVLHDHLVGGLPYYYAGGVHYMWRPEPRGYIVTQAPPESESERTAGTGCSPTR